MREVAGSHRGTKEKEKEMKKKGKKAEINQDHLRWGIERSANQMWLISLSPSLLLLLRPNSLFGSP